MTFPKQSMQYLSEIWPEFHAASYSQQRELLLGPFDSATCTISRLLFGMESQAVDSANILRGTAGERPR